MVIQWNHASPPQGRYCFRPEQKQNRDTSLAYEPRSAYVSITCTIGGRLFDCSRFRLALRFLCVQMLPCDSRDRLLLGGLQVACPSQCRADGRKQGGEIDSDSWRRAILPLGERDASLASRTTIKYLHVAFLTTDPGLRDRILNQGIFIWFRSERGGGEEVRASAIRLHGVRCRPPWTSFRIPKTTLPGSPATGWGKAGKIWRSTRTGTRSTSGWGKKTPGELMCGSRSCSDTLLYQLRVPLRSMVRGPYAVNAAPGDLIGVGIENSRQPHHGRIRRLRYFRSRSWRTVQLSSSPYPPVSRKRI